MKLKPFLGIPTSVARERRLRRGAVVQKRVRVWCADQHRDLVKEVGVLDRRDQNTICDVPRALAFRMWRLVLEQ